MSKRTRRRKKQKRYTRRKARPSLRLSLKKTKTKFTPLTFSDLTSPTKTKTKQTINRGVIDDQSNNKFKRLTISPVSINNKLTNHCERRKQRKEIIHAVNKSGQSGQNKPNNKTRNIKCQ